MTLTALSSGRSFSALLRTWTTDVTGARGSLSPTCQQRRTTTQPTPTSSATKTGTGLSAAKLPMALSGHLEVAVLSRGVALVTLEVQEQEGSSRHRQQEGQQVEEL